MSKKKEDIFKKLIDANVIDKAPVDFTKKVMQDVSILSNEELLEDKKLTSILKSSSIEKPSKNFVSTVLNTIEIKNQVTYKPVINKKAWFIIVTILISLVLYIIFYDSPTETTSVFSSVTSYIDSFNNVFSNFINGFKLSSIFTISLIALSSLLVLDFSLKNQYAN